MMCLVLTKLYIFFFLPQTHGKIVQCSGCKVMCRSFDATQCIGSNGAMESYCTTACMTKNKFATAAQSE